MQILLYCSIAVFVFQCLLFGVALAKKNNGIADIGWGMGFIIIAAMSCLLKFKDSNQDTDRTSQYLILILVCLWGMRLTVYLLIRNWTKPEDWRYAKWRMDWGKNFYLRSFLQVFMLQGLFMLVIGSPIMFGFISHIDYQERHFFSDNVELIIMIAGLLLWLIGFFFQSVGDYQLFVFKKDAANKGKVMRYGVWKYTRHPNYFGESTMWWGIFLISCVSAHGIGGVALRLIGPATITFMLLRVSGVTMLENKYKGNKEYEDYQKNTSAFIPMPVKKGE